MMQISIIVSALAYAMTARPQVFSIPVFAGPSIPRSDGDVFITINEEQILAGIVRIQ